MDFGNNGKNLSVLKFCSTVGTCEVCNSTDVGLSLSCHFLTFNCKVDYISLLCACISVTSYCITVLAILYI